jgi:hypothetical protein
VGADFAAGLGDSRAAERALGPAMAPVLRAFYGMNRPEVGLLITCEGPKLVRLPRIG